MAENKLSPQTEHSRNRIRAFGFVISVAVCVLLCMVLAAGPVRVSRSCPAELDSRINPNVAPMASLVRLPGIGPGRAAAILAYRTDFNREKPDTPAFGDCDDLQNVRGIGPKTVQNIRKWLKFE